MCGYIEGCVPPAGVYSLEERVSKSEQIFVNDRFWDDEYALGLISGIASLAWGESCPFDMRCKM